MNVTSQRLIHHTVWYCVLLLLIQANDVRPFSPINYKAQKLGGIAHHVLQTPQTHLQSQMRGGDGGERSNLSSKMSQQLLRDDHSTINGNTGAVHSKMSGVIVAVVDKEDDDTPAHAHEQRRQFLSNVAKMAVVASGINVLLRSSSANADDTSYEDGERFGEFVATVDDASYDGGEKLGEFVATVDDRKVIPSKPEVRKAVDVRYFIAGGGCASFSHGIATPFDVIKTKIQADPDTYNTGLLSAATTIIEEGGASVLLSGLGPTVLGFGVEGAMKFGVYETLKPQFVELFNTPDNTIPFLAASVCAGAIASLFLCPLEQVRIKMVTDTEFDTGLFSSLGSVIEQEGFLSLFKGFSAMLSKQVPYTATKQLSFEMIASSLYTVSSASSIVLPSTEVKLLVSITSAFLASILACIASNPGDVILTRTYSSKSNSDGTPNNNNNNENAIDTVLAIYDERGIEGLFSGLSARFIHVGAIVTSQLVIYDFLKQLLGLAATGA